MTCLYPTRQAAEAAADTRSRVQPLPGTSSWLVIADGDTIPHAWTARASDPDTSHAATPTSERVRADQALVLETHEMHRGGLTDFELGDLVDRQPTSAGKRRCELRDVGLIEDSGKRRNTPSGATAIVWRITDAGIEAARKDAAA